MPQEQSPEADEPSPGWVPGYPWWVRGLAVLHVLSHVLGPVGFVVLMAAACILSVRRRTVDDTVLALGALALACPPVCMIYRGWLERWGRRHWPNPPASSPPAADSASEIPHTTSP